MKILYLPETDSTNKWLSNHSSEEESPIMVFCDRQTAGRGQRGNSWESEPGKNLTCSVLLNPTEFLAVRQFLISEMVALSILKLLDRHGIKSSVKWPNDIYWKDKKICGILVEHKVTGNLITRTIVGIGLNINQLEFKSDAPNPVSMSLITGKEYDVAEIARELAQIIEDNQKKIYSDTIHQEFLGSLWKKDNRSYQFIDRVKNERIIASIYDVGLDGMLSLKDENGGIRNYYFKEVEFVL